MNNCTFLGRLTRDVELQYTTRGTPMAKFSLAVDRGYGDKKGTSYFDFVLWGKRAEALAHHLTRGKQLVVVAEAQQERWESDQGKRSKVTFHVSELAFAGGNNESSKQRVGMAEGPESFEDDVPF